MCQFIAQSLPANLSMPSSTFANETQIKPAPAGQDFSSASTQKSGVMLVFAKAAAVGALVVGLVPFLFICWLIASTGANNICVDYAAFTHVVDKVLSGQYHWLSIFSDSFIRTHMVLFPVLVHTAIAYIMHWDVTSELYVGMAFHAIRALLLADLIAGRSSNNWSRCAIVGVVASLVFAMSQTCIMIYGEASIAIGLCLLGFTFALWALCKFGRTPRSLALMVAGGVLSSYSFGNVVPCWATLLAAIMLLPTRGWTQRWDATKARFDRLTSTHTIESVSSFSADQIPLRSGPSSLAATERTINSRGDDAHSSRPIRSLFVNRKVAFVYWLIGTVVSLLPYYHFLAGRSVNNPELTRTFGFFDPFFLVNVLGRPFAKNMGMVYGKLPGAETSSLILLGLVVLLAVPTLIFQLKLSRLTKTGILLFAYGFISVWSVGVFRTHIAPWYASMSMYCWLAVFAVCVAYLRKAFSSRDVTAKAKIALIATSLVGLTTILVLYLTTNLSYRDKQFFLTARAPVSAEYLRSFETAPTFLESTIFSNDGRPDRILSFANSLAKHDLCVFAPKQIHALQGQFALDNVKIQRVPGSKRVAWLEGRNTRRRTSWRDYHHLNLDVPDGNIVDWRFFVPVEAKEAFFESSVSSYSDPARGCVKASAKVVSTISVVTTTAPPRVPGSESANFYTSSGSASYVTVCDSSWKPVRLNLLPYRGKTVTLRLASQSQESLYGGICDDPDCIPSSVLYKYPHINLVLDNQNSNAFEVKAIRPSNTDLSNEFPRNYIHQLDLPACDSKSWTDISLGLPQDKSAALQAKHWDVPEQQRLSIDDFDYLIFEMEPLPGKSWCSIKMHLQFDDGTTDGVSLPLLAEINSHRYSYPAKLLTPKSGAKLVGILLYASANDERTTKAKQTAVEKSIDSSVSDEPKGAPLSNCIHVTSIACVRAFSN